VHSDFPNALYIDVNLLVALSRVRIFVFNLKQSCDINRTEIQQLEKHLHDLHDQIPEFLGGQCVTWAAEFAPSV
jgi:hypothetical protein